MARALVMAVAAVAVFVLVTPALAARDLKTVSPAVGSVTGAVSGLLTGGSLPTGSLLPNLPVVAAPSLPSVPTVGTPTLPTPSLPVVGSVTGAVSGLLAGGILPSGSLPVVGSATGAVFGLIPTLPLAPAVASISSTLPTIPNLITPSIVLPTPPSIRDLDVPKSLPTLLLPTSPVVGAVQSIPIAGGLIG
ncbi:hypothetical protein MNEG_8558 [Monoraphidium neglectum]|uniref:Uncharacterized protein n=1 Tax=Monoraphidium neglectum TaxID=145388 RepID=A0A0D2JJA6_9CHLO|nr:hypothetical protein MNEG_8558 [Monoraphidium neglectum]KIY99402.1 hypothetical protein MNEG_8558 [Monoraphidium neglectum]|eukprot:XP_013898422.1 hypothetical protein MNEG_8558 [Monoraphidium neglectum]